MLAEVQHDDDSNNEQWIVHFSGPEPLSMDDQNVVMDGTVTGSQQLSYLQMVYNSTVGEWYVKANYGGQENVGGI